jgi:hypothetical protein
MTRTMTTIASSTAASPAQVVTATIANEIDSSWGDQCMVCPVKLNKHGRTVPNVGPLNLFTCFGVRIEAERAWYVQIANSEMSH